jgi:hypothetical protein
MTLDSQSQKLASEILENQGLQEPESEISSKAPDLRFEEVNGGHLEAYRRQRLQRLER